MKKILVTGGAGYIGSHTIRYFIDQGINPEEIVVFDNLIYGHEESLPEGVTFVKGDLLEKADINKVFDDHEIKAAIHFAAFSLVGESMKQPGKYFENNILGGLNLLNAMVANNCNEIIFSSTCAIFGIPKDLPITEDSLKEPINVYGESKLIFEKILEWYGKIFQVRSIVVRYFNASGAAYGIGEGHNPETHLIPLILEAAKGNRENISIFGDDYNTPDGTCIRDYIHVLDLADAHLKAMRYFDTADFVSESFNLGSEKGYSIKEILKYTEEIVGHPIPTVFCGRREGDPEILIASSKKANKKLDWRAKRGIRESIQSAWQWHNKKS